MRRDREEAEPLPHARGAFIHWTNPFESSAYPSFSAF